MQNAHHSQVSFNRDFERSPNNAWKVSSDKQKKAKIKSSERAFERKENTEWNG